MQIRFWLAGAFALVVCSVCASAQTASPQTGTIARRPGEARQGFMVTQVPEKPKRPMTVTAYSGVELLLKDPKGRKVGFENGVTKQEIRDSYYGDTDAPDCDDCGEDEDTGEGPSGMEVGLTDAQPGTYELTVMNTTAQPQKYALDVRVYGFEFPKGTNAMKILPEATIAPRQVQSFEVVVKGPQEDIQVTPMPASAGQAAAPSKPPQ